MANQNTYIFLNDCVIGKASNTKNEFFIDYEDFEKIKNYCWHERKNGYLGAWINGKIVLLHRFLMNPESHFVVDHINHNKKDNRKVNLRICTNAENCHNRKVKPIGVHIDKRGNRIYFKVYMNNKYRGCFKTHEEAKAVRDKVIKEEYS